MASNTEEIKPCQSSGDGDDNHSKKKDDVKIKEKLFPTVAMVR